MKKYTAALLAICLFVNSICMPVMAADFVVDAADAVIIEDASQVDDMQQEGAEVPEVINPEEDQSDAELPESVSDESLPDSLMDPVPGDTESVAATLEAESVPTGEELVGTAENKGTDAGIQTADYYIVSAQDESKLIHVKGKSASNSANIMLYAKNGSDAQRFRVTNYGNGVYGIVNIYSKKALTVSAASTAAGANVVQFTNNDMDNKRWYIQKGTKAGYCTIQTRLSDNVLSIEGGKASDYANIFVDTNKNADTQQWKFIKCENQTIPWTKANIKTGYYMLQSKLKSDRYLEVASDSWANGGNIQLGPTCTNASRVFYVTNLGDGRYRLQACVSGHYMEVLSNTMAAGTNICQGTTNSGAKQIFYVSTNRSDGYYFIKPSQNIHKFAIGVKGGSTSLKTNVYLTNYNSSFQAQMFKFVPVSTPTAVVKEGAYQIAFTNSQSFVASIPAKNNNDNSTAALYKNEANNYQKFQIVPLGDGYCKILVAANQKALTVKDNGTGNNVDVVQKAYTGANGQKWKIVGCRNRFKFLSKLNGKALTANSSTAANNVNLKMYTDSSGSNNTQTFGLMITTVTSSSTRGYVYMTDPATKKSFKLEKQIQTDPNVSDNDFLAAVLYTEAGDQGIAGMMMVAYCIKTRMAEGIAAAKAGDYVEYPGTLKYMIYQYGQWEVARDGALTRVLTDISIGQASYLAKARQAATNANANKDITLEADATKYVRKDAKTSTQSTLKNGSKIKAADFKYNSFMTPSAWNRFATSGSYPKFAAGYGNGKNSLLYKGHIFFMDSEVW